MLRVERSHESYCVLQSLCYSSSMCTLTDTTGLLKIMPIIHAECEKKLENKTKKNTSLPAPRDPQY